VPIKPIDSARLKADFDNDVETHLPKVQPQMATAILTSSIGIQHSSSDDDSDGSSSKSDPSYVKKLEQLIEGQDRQLKVLTNVDMHNRLRWEDERQQRAVDTERWQEERTRLENERNGERRSKLISDGLAIFSMIAGTVLGLYPLIDKAVNGCG
jgi:hypothetical protein